MAGRDRLGARRARYRGVPRQHRPVNPALGPAPATASDGPSFEAFRDALGERHARGLVRRTDRDRNRVVRSSGRLPRRPDRRPRARRARLVLVGRPRVRLALDRPADGIAPGPGAPPSSPAPGRAGGRELDREMGEGQERRGRPATARWIGRRSATRDRCAAWSRRLEPAGRCPVRRRRASGVVLARPGRSVTRRVSPPGGLELAVGRPSGRPAQARAGTAVALKIEVCASSGSITPKIFCSVRRWTQEPQLSK